MGVLCQSFNSYKNKRDPQLAVYSPEIEQLFYIFLLRYQEWREAKRQENILFIGLVCMGLTAFLAPWLIPRLSIILGLICLFFFCIMIVIYRRVSGSVYHNGINARILHHHLIGKLEVGFCTHDQPCSCVQDFRDYVQQKYLISLFGEPFNF